MTLEERAGGEVTRCDKLRSETELPNLRRPDCPMQIWQIASSPRLHRPMQFHQAPFECGRANPRWTGRNRTLLKCGGQIASLRYGIMRSRAPDETIYARKRIGVRCLGRPLLRAQTQFRRAAVHVRWNRKIVVSGPWALRSTQAHGPFCDTM